MYVMAKRADFEGAIFDASFDPSPLIFVPEPDVNLGLVAGAVALTFLRRRRFARCHGPELQARRIR